MSTLISDNIQLGQNVDSTKNFTLQNPDNGTAVFSTGNSGNTLYDVFIIQSDGTAHFSGATFFNGNATFNSYAIFTGAVSAPTFNGSIVGGTGSFTTLTTSGDATINGNLIVVGDTVTVDTQTLIVEDNNITLGNVATPSNVTATGGGITVLGDTSKTFNWESPSAGWTSSEYITAPGFLGTASNVVTNANLTGDVTSIGNATTLATVNPNTGSFGSSSSVPVITVNGKGLVTSVTTSAISSTISVTGGDLTLSGTTGVDITNATLATVNSAPGIFGDTTHVPQIIVDGKGRVTSAGNIAINTMVYPGAGFAHSTGTAWDTSYSSTGTGNVVLSSGATIATPTITTPTISNPTVSGAITGGFNGAVTTLAVASNAVAVDLSVNNNFAVTLQATTTQTLSNPINAVAGQSGQISITQNATPSVLNFGANWESINGSTTVNSTAGSVTLLTYYVVDSTHIWFGLGTGTSTLSGVSSFNTRTGAVTLTSGDVTTALTYTPYNSTNPSGYISGITAGNVEVALGYTPYNANINANGYITSTDSITGSASTANALNSATTAINVSLAAAPSSGQVLTATSSTAATWQTPSGGSFNQGVAFAFSARHG